MSTDEPAGLKAGSDEDDRCIDDGRPDDCLCGEDDLDVACWPCYRDGFAFEEPNPDPPEDDEAGR